MTAPRSRLLLPAGLVLATGLALAPWWRHRGFLRDLYDYGLVLAANGRLAAGEKPYVDFTTPIQSGFLGLGWLAERWGGGTYGGMTWGAAALIAVTTIALALLLRRRWPAWLAVGAALAVAVGGPSQHTILWHNTLGLACLALVAWATALAPVWRRETAGLAGVAGLALFVGGINKLNFQLVALAVALAWAVYRGLSGRAGWRAVAVTAGGWLTVGALLPWVFELAWTGASPAQWWDNVVALPAGARAETLAEILSPAFLWRPIHDYYGPLLFPAVGALGVAMTAAAWFGCRPAAGGAGPAWFERAVRTAGVALAALAGAMLLATNQEIACVGLAAWFALLVSAWLGFDADVRPPARAALVAVPAAVLVVLGWAAAWQGQRSQFGYSPAPRSAYLPVTAAGEAFAPLAGLRLPPETVETIRTMAAWLPPAAADGRRPVFYGTGCEWLGRFLPGLARPGEPLWVHWGTSYGPEEARRLRLMFEHDLRCRVVVTTLARDDWPAELRTVLAAGFQRSLLGAVVVRWERRADDLRVAADSIDFLGVAGGNVASAALHFGDYPLGLFSTATAGSVLGIRAGEGHVRVWPPTYRLGGDAVLERRDGATGPLRAEFRAVVHGSNPEEVRWAATLELPAGRRAATLPFVLDGLGRSLLLKIVVPDSQAGEATAGYRNLQITHAGESGVDAPRLRAGAPAEVGLRARDLDPFWGAVAWRPEAFVLRGGAATDQGLALGAGGELWFHTAAMQGEVRGLITAAGAGTALPTVRVVWSKGARLQVLQQGAVPPDRGFPFHVWTAEPGGWIGVLVDPGPIGAPAVVRIESARLAP